MLWEDRRDLLWCSKTRFCCRERTRYMVRCYKKSTRAGACDTDRDMMWLHSCVAFGTVRTSWWVVFIVADGTQPNVATLIVPVVQKFSNIRSDPEFSGWSEERGWRLSGVSVCRGFSRRHLPSRGRSCAAPEFPSPGHPHNNGADRAE